MVIPKWKFGPAKDIKQAGPGATPMKVKTTTGKKTKGKKKKKILTTVKLSQQIGISQPLKTIMEQAEDYAEEKKAEGKKPIHVDVLKAIIQSAKPGNKPLPGYEQTGISGIKVAALALSSKYRSSIDPIEDATKDLMRAESNQMTIKEYISKQKVMGPIHIPSSEYGAYDTVTTGLPMKDETGRLVPGTVFEYSDKAKHKIKVAGSVENYNRYLKEVRQKTLLPVVNAILGKSFNLDLAFASNKPGVAGASEREEILIKLLHDYKGSPEGGFDPGKFGGAFVGSGGFAVGTAMAGGAVIGKVAGGASGYLASRFGPRAVQAFNLALMTTGTALTLPKTIEIAEKAAKGKTGKAAEEAVMLGLLLASGIAGYRYGRGTPMRFGKGKGLTPYEAGFKKGLIKSKYYDPVQKEYYNILSDIKQDLRLKHVAPIQEEPTYMNVEALKKYNLQKANVLRTVIKNQLIALKNRAQISGGAGTEKPSTHDIDQLFRSAKDPVVLEYIARKLGIDPNLVFDPHQLPGTGSLITRSGTPKESPYVYPSGQRGIKFTEQFYRLGESSVDLPHKGRVKDISEAVRILNKIYGKTGGVPKSMQGKVQRFVQLSAMLERDPRLMDPKFSKLLYDSGLSKKLWNIRTKFYQKVLPKSYLSKQFGRFTKADMVAYQNLMNMGAAGGLPPTVSMPFAESSYLAGGWGAFFQSLASGSKPKQLPGISMLPSKQPSMYPGEIPSIYPETMPDYYDTDRPSKRRRSRRYRPPPGVIPSPPYVPPPSQPPYVPPPSQPPYVPPPSRPPYVPPPDTPSPIPPDYPSPPSTPTPTPPSTPSTRPPRRTPPYYPSDTPSIIPPSTPSTRPPYYPYPPYYPPSGTTPPPPPANLLWFPGMGGRIAGKGKSDPYSVRYYNEYQAIQNLMRNVIF